MRELCCVVLLAVLGQTGDGPRFEIADVHVSAPAVGNRSVFMRLGAVRAGRYEITTATMVDLISFAWGYLPNRVLGGPSWLEQDRFDVIAKVPADSARESLPAMVQALLEERFRLKVHKDTQPLPAMALVAAKPKMKEADGKGETGCKPQAAPAGPPGAGEGRLSMVINGAPATFALGQGGTLTYECRNITMAAFAEGMGRMMGAYQAVGQNPVLNETGLEGRWNFDVKWSITMGGPETSDRVLVTEALEKQLGLKLEPRQVPTEVLVVDSVDRVPSANPKGVAEALPVNAAATEFEVADVKVADPAGPRTGGIRVQPGGRVTATGVAMQQLLYRAFDVGSSEDVVGLPGWADTARYDISAKVGEQGPGAQALDIFSVATPLRKLLEERFGLKFHEEERQGTVYALVAGKPKLKKADPASRTWCKQQPAGPEAPAGTLVIQCQNATMAMLAAQLRGTTQEIMRPVRDATGIEGGWDFSVAYSRVFPRAVPVGGAGGRGGDAGAGLGDASDPTGGVTIFQALEKQLGLKLEAQKRPVKVWVIDHLEQKPTEN